MPVWLKEKLFQRICCARSSSELWTDVAGKIVSVRRAPQPRRERVLPVAVREAAVLTMDGVGEWATASIGVGRGHDLEMLRELQFPHSLGLLYSAFTYYTGFKVNSGEYKVMGLAPYGEPRYARLDPATTCSISRTTARSG